MRILIVDDDMPTVDAIISAVNWKSIGIDEVERAYSVAQAKSVIKENEVDIIVSDIEMPQQSGLDLLSWVRDQGSNEVQFLFLTCHEKFDYANSAIRLNAAAYLTKPFDAELMQMSLQKIVATINENKLLKESSERGAWYTRNQRAQEHAFWLSLYNGFNRNSHAEIMQEIQARNLPIDTEVRYRMILTKIDEFETAAEEIGQDLLFYVMESIYSRIFYGSEGNHRVIRRFGTSGLWFFLSVPDEEEAVLRERCANALRACHEATHVKGTICIGDACEIERLPKKLIAIQKLLTQSVALYGQVFTQREGVQAANGESQVLKIDKLEELLLVYDKVSILNYLKDVLSSRVALKTLSERTLYLIRQEMQQAVYAHLLRAGVQVTSLFHDENSVRLSERACRSAVDMLRWTNYLLEKTFACQATLNKPDSLIQRIQAYIHEHYREDVGRNQIAAEFHLTPEYLAKLYHKKTGKYLKDTLKEYRVEQAKRLLMDDEVLISDVAVAVGFSNFSYFSTVFKKQTGFAPQEYRRQAEKRLRPDTLLKN
ncbi:MAG: response regulator [Clostridiales bacterium]|nr:response regulator [Clostridiales bacterium]